MDLRAQGRGHGGRLPPRVRRRRRRGLQGARGRALKLARSSGVQLHLTSLPGGRLGPEARAFVDWLADAGQSWWQVLPLGPPDEHGSPYKAASAFAASPALLAEPGALVSSSEVAAFRAREAFWIEGWEAHAGPGAVEDQVRFDREWGALRAYAAARGVRLVGDVPIYVAPEEADVRTWPWLFQEGAVAGAPPDRYSDEGQHWGNPLYDWPALQRRGYRWWIERLRRTFELFDVARVDHFRGFVSYWAVPADAETAAAGHWRRGPGRAMFDHARAALGRLPLIAEDLGVITEPVRRLRRTLGLPGMVVLQFAFDPDDRDGTHAPANHGEDQVAYTGTHDQDTARGWWETLPPESRELAAAAGVGGEEPGWDLARLAFSSVCPLAMIQAQDVLGLGSEARMNVPGREGGNWSWRLEPGQLTAEHARRLRALTEESGRLRR